MRPNAQRSARRGHRRASSHRQTKARSKVSRCESRTNCKNANRGGEGHPGRAKRERLKSRRKSRNKRERKRTGGSQGRKRWKAANTGRSGEQRHTRSYMPGIKQAHPKPARAKKAGAHQKRAKSHGTKEGSSSRTLRPGSGSAKGQWRRGARGPPWGKQRQKQDPKEQHTKRRRGEGANAAAEEREGRNGHPSRAGAAGGMEKGDGNRRQKHTTRPEQNDVSKGQAALQRKEKAEYA